MKMIRSAILAAALLCTACSLNPWTGNPVGAPIRNETNDLDKACVLDAIECVHELAGTGAQAQVFIVRYAGTNGQFYRHAMTRYFWPSRLNKYAVAYVYDRANASTALPAGLDADNAVAVASYMLPTTSAAWWTDPQALPR